MKEKIVYVMIFITYLFIDVLIYFLSSMQGDTVYFWISLIATCMLWYLTIKVLEKRELLINKTSKLSMLFDYLDFDSALAVLKIKSDKRKRFEIFDGDDDEKKITILTIKILNDEEVRNASKNERLRIMNELLTVIDQVIKKKYGIIYDIKDDTITCVFNVVYEVTDVDLEAIKAALNINLYVLKLKESHKYMKNVVLNMSIVNKSMDFFIRGKRVLIYGDFNLCNELVDIDGYDNIIIPSEIFGKYVTDLDTEYLGKFYFNNEECKLHKVLKVNKEEYDLKMNFEKSKLKIKKGMDKTLQQFASKIKKG